MAQVVLTFTTAGTFSFIVPGNLFLIDLVECWGGGGGGAGSRTAATAGVGGGGAAYSATPNLSVLPFTSITYVVGAAGTGGPSVTDGTAGGDSTWATTVIVAKGGPGGNHSATTATQGAQSTAGTGTTKFS